MILQNVMKLQSSLAGTHLMIIREAAGWRWLNRKGSSASLALGRRIRGRTVGNEPVVEVRGCESLRILKRVAGPDSPALWTIAETEAAPTEAAPLPAKSEGFFGHWLEIWRGWTRRARPIAG
jgi:hypothetical protein